MSAMMRKLGWGVLALLATGVGAVSLRYLMPEPPMGAANVLANPFAQPWLAIHAGAAATALMVGAFQFVRPRGRRSPWHRTMGAVYMAACLIGAPAGLVLAVGSTAGPIATAGFGSLAVLWFVFTALGLRTVLVGDYAAHRRWMIRGYALTFAAVMLRLYLPLSPMFGLEFMDAYRAISFLCWVPNLLVAELWLSLAGRGHHQPARLSAAA